VGFVCGKIVLPFVNCPLFVGEKIRPKTHAVESSGIRKALHLRRARAKSL
jgi:hypothetical protein